MTRRPYKGTPAKLSPGEEQFAQHCACYKLTPEREHVFAPPRRFRFDFAWPEKKIAAEVEGGTWQKGRHTRGGGFASDCTKYNLAASLGWLVFRFPTEMVVSGEAIDTMVKVLK